MSIIKQEELRLEFPFFREYPDWIFLENAGGSQVPSSVIESISKYYSRSYVQLSAGYHQSNEATHIVKLAHDFCREMMNSTGIGEVVLGSSTTQLVHTLSHAFDKLITSTNDEIILTNIAHEANYGAWTKLRGKVIEWKAHERVNLDDLAALLSERTRIVAIPHVSNLVGEILDVQAIVKLVHGQCPRARVIVDGVAYAPHRAIDVRQWNVDFYVFSLYKVKLHIIFFICIIFYRFMVLTWLFYMVRMMLGKNLVKFLLDLITSLFHNQIFHINMKLDVLIMKHVQAF